MKYIGQMWKRIFDYKGKSSMKEYWVPFVFNAVLAVIMVLCLLLKEVFALFFMAFPAIIIAAYLCLSFIPFISLTVRRLHDAGKSGKWYLLSFVLGVGAVIVIIMCAGRADMFDPRSNMLICVYGPPSYDPSENINVDVYGPPGYFDGEEPEEESAVTYPDDSALYVPEENIAATVYGPPVISETGSEENEASETMTTEEETVTESAAVSETTVLSEENAEEIVTEAVVAETVISEETYYDPEENINEDVYGPPEYFKSSEDGEEADPVILDEVFEPFVPEENAPVCVYGPPEFFQ